MLTIYMGLTLVNQAIAVEQNLIHNGNFELDNSAWKLNDSKGNPGGEILKELNGNHFLNGAKGRTFLAHLEGDGLDREGIKKLAGSKVTLTFRVKGDLESHPKMVLSIRAGGKPSVKMLVWKRKVQHLDVQMQPLWKTVSRTILLPADLEEVFSMDVLCDGSPEGISIDDIHLEAWNEKKAPSTEWDPSWLNMTFESGEEILELANTCNFLLCEWTRVLSDFQGLQRSIYYFPDMKGAEEVKPLKQSVENYRNELNALRGFYVKVMTERFGKISNPDQAAEFYSHNNFTGKKLMYSVMNRKSSKEPAVAFEKKLSNIKQHITHLQKEFFKQACNQSGWTPDPLAPYIRPEKLFDSKGNPTHILMGLRTGGQYSLFANQWLEPEITMNTDFPANPESAQPILAKYAELLYPFKTKGWTRPSLDAGSLFFNRDFLDMTDANPDDCYEFSEDGVVFPLEIGSRKWYHRFQFLNPKVMSALEEQYTVFSKNCKKHENVNACLFFASEPKTWVNRNGGVNLENAIPIGFSARFRKGFQERLIEKFKDIDHLNRDWNTSYRNFDEIQLPTAKQAESMDEKDLPLIYEFRKFRKDVYSTFYEKIYAAIKKGSDMPVANGWGRDYMNGNSLDTWHTLRQVKSTDINTFHNCAEGTARHDADNAYKQSLARYCGMKKCGSDEYYPSNPLTLTWSWQEDPLVLFEFSAQTVWKDLASNYAMFYFWFQSHITKEFAMGSYEYQSSYTLLDEYFGVISYIQKRLKDGCHDAFFKTQKVPSEVAVLAPFDGTMTCWPDARIMEEGWLTHNFLTDNYWEYEYAPEELVVSGEETLEGFKVLWTPYTLWATDKSQEKLLRWVENGGTLIAVGPYGYWNEYGRRSGRLIQTCFGNLPLEAKKGKLYWTFKLNESALEAFPSVKMECARAGEARLISVKYGKGKVYLSTDSTLETLPTDGKRKLNSVILDHIGLPTAFSQNRCFSLYTRENPDSKDRYLTIVNKDSREGAEDTITLLGEYPQPIDITCPGGFPVPVQKGKGYTKLRVSLMGGEGICLKLGKYNKNPIDRDAVALLVGNQNQDARQKVWDILDQITPQGETAYARALTCRNLALELMKSENFGQSLLWAQKGLENAKLVDSDKSSEDYHGTYTAIPVTVDGDEQDWQDSKWNAFGESRFKIKWDERHLYVLAEMIDQKLYTGALIGELYRDDCLEFYLNLLNEGGHRKLDQLDYQYCISASGKAQMNNSRGGIRSTHAKSMVKLTEKGYRLEFAIPHSETMLSPVDGTRIAINLRQIDFDMTTNSAMSPGKLVKDVIKDTKLKDSGAALFTDTFGWPVLKLEGGPKSLKPSVQYIKGEKRIIVRGKNNTLEQVVKAVNDPDAFRIDKEEGALLGADIEVADSAELALTMNLRSRDKNHKVTLKAGTRSILEVREKCDLINVELTPEAEKSLWSTGATQLRTMGEVGLTVTDKNGRLLPKVNCSLQGRNKKDGRVAFEYSSLYLNENGHTTFLAPKKVFEINAESHTSESGQFEVIVDDKEMNSNAMIPDLVEPLKKAEYKAVFTLFRHENHKK